MLITNLCAGRYPWRPPGAHRNSAVERRYPNFERTELLPPGGESETERKEGKVT